MNKIEESRADINQLLDFIEQVASWSTGPIRSQCNVLLDKHKRKIVPLHFPMLRAPGPAHSQGQTSVVK